MLSMESMIAISSRRGEGNRGREIQGITDHHGRSAPSQWQKVCDCFGIYINKKNERKTK